MESKKSLKILGARVNNLKNIDLEIDLDQLVVITGLSGSGKSSLAFNTIYAEGQRRYMETFSAYARQFLGKLDRPDVDRITGLSPVVSIEQKTTNKNPRSTVGTITEIYDFLRLFYARVGDAYSYNTGEKMLKFSEEKIIKLILEKYDGQDIILLAPQISGRKGHYKELFIQISRKGYSKAYVDGELVDIRPGYQLDRYKIHDIDIVIDRITIDEANIKRITRSVKDALKNGKGVFKILFEDEVSYLSKFLMCPSSGLSYPEPEPNTFSFNSPYGACPNCNGIGYVNKLDMSKVIPNTKLSVAQGGIVPLGEERNNWAFNQVDALLKSRGYSKKTPIKDLSTEMIDLILYGSKDNVVLKNSFLGINSEIEVDFQGVIQYVISQTASKSTSKSASRWAEKFMQYIPCPECNGARLNKISLHYKIHDKNIADLAAMDLIGLNKWFNNVYKHLDENKKIISKEIIREIQTRLSFLLNVGLDYLSLDRTSRSLSGGESQRIRLASQIGAQLVGVMYILDEPSIGLHQRDNNKLIKSLKELRDVGNSVIVVEHDKEIMLAADQIIDIGPKAGNDGGEIVAMGKADEMLGFDTLTADYLSGRTSIPIPEIRRPSSNKEIVLKGAKGHNLKNVTLHIPLSQLICVTGVSGSGKSSIINETLYPILNKHFYRAVAEPLQYKSIEGVENIDKIVEIDQNPIGRTPRSNPATYTGMFDEIRKIFTQLPESKIRGYKPGRFSFNVKGGRCEECKGAGIRLIEMNFLPDVYVPCEKCNGKRYNRETLEVRYKGKSINDLLQMDINEALVFFENIAFIRNKIQTLADVGLGYIKLGQPSTTLSGGEAQRIKLATELSKKGTGKTLYILDEPTTGLHFEDIRMLLGVLNRLVDKGNTVIVIEHNMDVIKSADHVIDIGPDGGKRGGKIVAVGTPEEIVKQGIGFTAEYLKKEL